MLNRWLRVHSNFTPALLAIRVVHESLKPRHPLPREHLVDKGYTDSHILVDSQRHYGVTIVGPVADDPGWQAREGTGFDKSQELISIYDILCLR